MAEITSEQWDFLERHNIPAAYIFDAGGLRPTEFKQDMEASGTYFAIGVSRCKAGGHSLRDRNNHCIQCNTAYITFALRNHKTAFVYVAASRLTGLLKVGSSQNPDVRVQQINSDKIGNTDDWIIINKFKCNYAGTMEFMIHKYLKTYNVPVKYFKGKKLQTSYEVFSCGYGRVRSFICTQLTKDEILKMQERSNATISYNFSDVEQVRS